MSDTLPGPSRLPRERLSAWRQAARAVVAFMNKLPLHNLSVRPDDDRRFHLTPGGPLPDVPSLGQAPDAAERRVAEVLFYWAGGVMVSYETMGVPAAERGRSRRRAEEDDPDARYGDLLYDTIAPRGDRRPHRLELTKRAYREVAADPERHRLVTGLADGLLASPDRRLTSPEARRLILRLYLGGPRSRPAGPLTAYARFSGVGSRRGLQILRAQL